MQHDHSVVYGLWSGLILLLVAQPFWNLFFSYPASFERMLRRGRSWVYIPLRWKGARKFQVLLVSRLILVGIALAGALLLKHYTARTQSLWFAGFLLVCYAAAAWLQSFWNGLRYRQQEDAYFLLHDEMRDRFEQENKDYSEAQLRSLSAYQHQQRLHKADEEGRFLAVLREEARRFRQARIASPRATPEA